MHIGINAHLLSFSPTYRGAGISRYIRSLIPRLREIDETHYTVFLGDRNIPPDFAPDARLDLRISLLPTVKPVVRILWEQLVLPMHLASSSIDLLHCAGYVQPLACPKPSVVTVHDLSFLLFPSMFNNANRLYLSLFTRLSVQRANSVIAVSQHTKGDLIRHYHLPGSKIAVVHHGVEHIFRPIEGDAQIARFRAARGLPQRYVLFVGTLEPRKNVRTLLEAFARLKNAAMPHKLVIGGARGWLWSEIFAVVEKLHLESDVIFPGYIDIAELPLWYNGADLFVYPSLYEGFGFPVLEAMACGTPVIASNSSSLPEVVGDAGLLVDPTSSSDIAEAMLAVLSNPTLSEEMRNKGLKRAARFTWDEAARQTVSIYKSCLSAKREG